MGIKEEAYEQIATLPQFPVLPRDRIERWVADMLKICSTKEQLVWHIERLRGIGGSEIGALAGELLGHFVFPDQDTRSIVQRKLMLKTPSPGTGDMRRGVHMEDFVRTSFLEKFNAKRDLMALECLQNAQIDPAHPWRVGNVDDVVVINNQRAIPDYKVPRPENYEKISVHGVPFAYSAQLHHYHALAVSAGLALDGGMLLVPFDLNNWEPSAYRVRYSQGFLDDLTRVGDHVWNEYVLKGKVPRVTVAQDKKTADISVGRLPPSLRQEIGEAAILKHFSDRSYSAFNAKQLRIKGALEAIVESRKAKGEYAGFDLRVDTIRPLKLSKAVEVLLAEGRNMTELLFEGDQIYDPKKVEAAIRECVTDERVLSTLYEAPKRTSSVTLTRKRAGAQFEFKKGMSEFAEVTIQGAFQQGKEMLQNSPLTKPAEQNHNREAGDKPGDDHEQQKPTPSTNAGAGPTL